LLYKTSKKFSPLDLSGFMANSAMNELKRRPLSAKGESLRFKDEGSIV